MFKKTENVVKPIETEKTDKPSVPKEFQGFQGSKEFQGFQGIKENIDSTDENNVTETLVESENVVKHIGAEKIDEPSVLKEFQGFQGFHGSQGFQEVKENIDNADEFFEPECANENDVTETFVESENVDKPNETAKTDEPNLPKEFQGFQEIKENIDNTDKFFEPECANKNDVTDTLVESENDDKPIETAKTDELIGFRIHKRIHSDEKLTPQSPKSPYMKAMANYRDKLADLISPITNESELKKPMIPESSNQKVRKKKKSDNSEFLSDTTSYTDVSTKKEKFVKTEESKRKCEVCKHIFYDASSLRKHKKRKRCKQLISPIKKPEVQEENEDFDKTYESFESESADVNNVIGTFDQSEYEKRRVIY